MKRTLSMILAVAMLLCVALTLVSCGPSGTYEGKFFDLKFKGDDVTVIVGSGEDEKTLTGTFEITEDEDGKQYISFDFIDEDSASDDQKYVLNIIDALLSGKIAYAEEDGTITLGSGILASKFTKK